MRQQSTPREYCGLCGVCSGESVLEHIHLGLHSLQHRGQEAAGIMAIVDGRCCLHRGPGLVDHVFGRIPSHWRGGAVTRGIAHTRYSTAGGSADGNAQPLVANLAGHTVGIAHNGTICNGRSLRTELLQHGAIFQTSTDTELILHMVARSLINTFNGDFLAALQDALRRVRGAFSLLIMTEEYFIAVRDPHGFRPLAIADFADGGFMVASETIAFNVAGAHYMREVNPGEMIVWDRDNRMQSHIFEKSTRRAHCIFEHVYFARPGSKVFGDSVYQLRKAMGRVLAREQPVEADVIVPVPDSGVYAGLGYAEESGIPYDMGLSRNHYVGRTFIDPGLVSRSQLVRRKLQPIEEALVGKRVCLVEDSIVRGSTSQARVHTLRQCGVKEVHMRVSCPPHRHGCYFGIDFPRKEKLLANRVPSEEVCRALQLDSLGYLSKEGMLSCVTAHPPSDYCCACFDGEYPVLPDTMDDTPMPKVAPGCGS